MSPIKVNITEAQDFNKYGHPRGNIPYVYADPSVLNQVIPEELSATDDTEMKSRDELIDIEAVNNQETHHDDDACDSLLKPDDADAQYISDEDLIEKGDLVKGYREFADEYLHETEENGALSCLPDEACDEGEGIEMSDNKEDEVIESYDTKENLDDELDDSVDEFLELEKQLATECEKTDTGNISDIRPRSEELNAGIDEYMQAIQDLSSQETEKGKEVHFHDSDDEARYKERHEGECLDTQPEISLENPSEPDIDQLNKSDVVSSMDEPKSVPYTKEISGQTGPGIDADRETLANEDVVEDDRMSEEPRRHSSTSDVDFQSGEENVSTDGPSDVTKDDDTESDSDDKVYECTSDLPEGDVKQPECDDAASITTKVANDENGDDTIDRSVDEQAEKLEEHMDAVDEIKKDDDEKQGAEMAIAGMPEFSSDDKDEKCKIS